MTRTRFYIPKDATDEEALEIVRGAIELAKRGGARSKDAASKPEQVGVLEQRIELDELVDLDGGVVGTGE